MFPGKTPVLITWIDACSETARMHHDPDALANVVLARMCNIGYILHEDDDRIILAHGKGSTEEIDVFVIPVNSILERVEINGEEETDQEEDSEETEPKDKEDFYFNRFGFPIPVDHKEDREPPQVACLDPQ